MSSDYDLNLTDEPSKSGSSRSIIYKIPRKVRIVACIILFAFIIIALLNAFKPEARKRPIPETVVRVEVIKADMGDYPIIVNANGTVEAQTRGELVAQIRGEIVAVSDNFRNGGTFKKGDLLIQLDKRDYQAELSSALAQLSQAEAAYRQEQATSKQAKQDWQRLGNTAPAPDLVLRKPQLTAAKAQYDSASAAHDTAKLNLSRTAITAPYDGRIIDRRAVLGQYVSIGSPIAEVFATDGVEVRLPVSQEEFSQLGLDNFSNSNEENKNSLNFEVLINSTIGNQAYQWDAVISNTDSTFDINTRQIDVIAEVTDPFGKNSGQPALKIGQFVNAQIKGRTIKNVFVIPNKSIREGSYVYAVRDGKLSKQSIKIVWQDDQNSLVSEGVNVGELVVTTSLNSTLAGASAKLAGDESKANKNGPSAKESDTSRELATDQTNANNAPAVLDAAVESSLATETGNQISSKVQEAFSNSAEGSLSTPAEGSLSLEIDAEASAVQELETSTEINTTPNNSN